MWCSLALTICLTDVRCQGGAQATVVFEGVYPEGPVCPQEADQSLFVTDYAKHQVLELADNDSYVLWEEPGCGPADLARLPNGQWVVACLDASQLVWLSGDGALLHSQAMVHPSAVVADAQGGVYVASLGSQVADGGATGAVFYLPESGRLAKQVTGDLRYPDGLALSADGQTLWVAEHQGQRVLRYQTKPYGALQKTFAVHSQLKPPYGKISPENFGPDGLAALPQGAIWVAQYASSRAVQIGPDGVVLSTIRLHGPYPHITNVCTSQDTLVLTLSGPKGGVVVSLTHLTDTSTAKPALTVDCQVD